MFFGWTLKVKYTTHLLMFKAAAWGEVALETTVSMVFPFVAKQYTLQHLQHV